MEYRYSGCLHGLLTETCAIYRIGITRIGVTHVTDGVLTVLVGAFQMWMNQGTIWSGIGVWTGLPFMIAGVACLFSRRKRPRGRLSGVTAASIVALVAGGFLFSTSAYNVDSVLTAVNVTNAFPKYVLGGKTPLVATNSLLMALSLLEMVISGWAAAMSIGIVCLCCRHMKDNVFTIPYEGMDDTLDTGTRRTPRGPDIVPSAVAGGPGPASFFEELDDPGTDDLGSDYPEGPDLVSQGSTVRRKGAAGPPPVLQIDMDLEWDEMEVPPEDDDDPYDGLTKNNRLDQFVRA